MFGEVGSRRSARLPRVRRSVPSTLKEFEGLASSKVARLYSTHWPSRMHSNSMKTNDGCHVYPSQKPEDNVRDFRPLRDENSISLFSPRLSGVN